MGATAGENIAKLEKDKQGLTLKSKDLPPISKPEMDPLPPSKTKRSVLNKPMPPLWMTCKQWKTKLTTLERPRPSLNNKLKKPKMLWPVKRRLRLILTRSRESSTEN